jgi:hypothetical protein
MNAKYLLTWGIVIGFGLGAVAISGRWTGGRRERFCPSSKSCAIILRFRFFMSPTT